MTLLLKMAPSFFTVLLVVIAFQKVQSTTLETSGNEGILRGPEKKGQDDDALKPVGGGQAEEVRLWGNGEFYDLGLVGEQVEGIAIRWFLKKEEEEDQEQILRKRIRPDIKMPLIPADDLRSPLSSRNNQGRTAENEVEETIGTDPAEMAGGGKDTSRRQMPVKNGTSAPATSNEDGCVPYQIIWPCSCETDEYNDVTIACYGAQGTDLVHRALMPDYPNPNMKKLRVLQSNVGQFPKDILHGKTFEEMDLYGSGLQSLEEGAFDGCHKTLKLIRLSSNHLKNFTFAQLPNFPNLEMLSLSDNQLTSIDGLVGLPPISLTTLYIGRNHIKSLHPEVFFSLPKLSMVDLSNNDISSIPPGVFLPLTELEVLYVYKNNILHLSTGSLWFSTPILRSLDIRHNGIESVDIDVFRGVGLDTKVNMDMNHLHHLYPDTFLPVLRNVSTDYGWLSIFANWLVCDCDVLWIIEDESLLDHLFSAACNNLTYLEDLNVEVLEEECSLGPLHMIYGDD